MLGQEVMLIFAEFHEKDLSCKSWSSTFISLIPKKESAVKIRDYRPISLIGSPYKLLSKACSPYP